MASISSTNSDLLPSWPSEINSAALRDVSFSSYLNSSEESFIRSLVESNQTLKNNVEDCEIDVFSADKYFNGEKTQAKVGTINTEKRRFDHHLHQEVVYQPRTPSNQSESSSWNSRSTLLKRVPRAPSRRSNGSGNFNSSNKSKIQGKRLFLSCCSCSDKTSADVEEHMIKSQIKRDFDLRSIKTNLEISEITRLNKLRLQKETSDPFLFPQPVSDSPVSARNLINGVENPPIKVQTDEEKRESIDVFGTNDFDEHGVIERGLNISSWDAIPRVEIDDIISNQSESCKDSESDASSDLFEIECLSCTANPVVGPTTPSECYAPSEASIEWSVFTASAAEFSAYSDCEDQRSSITSVSKCRKNPPKLSPSNKMNGIMLAGCRSQKAVKVAGDHVYRTPVRHNNVDKERRPRYSDSAMAMTRFQAEAMVAGLGQKQRKEIPLVSPRPPRWSMSSPASHLLQF